MSGATIEVSVHFGRTGRHGRVEASDTPMAVADVPRIARVTRWMALAIHLERMLHDGEVRDQAELARLSGVTRARITQILNLLHLAPDIQEELLFMMHTSPRDPIILRDLQPIARTLSWARQRQIWKALREECGV